MKKIEIFLSSKVTPIFENIDVSDYSLEKLRKFIKSEFESIEFLGEKIFSVVTNEEGFESTFTSDAFDTCIENIKKCDLIIILYNGDAGWAPDGDEKVNGICHEEYITAIQELPSMTKGINISSYFENIKYKADQKTRNKKFEDDINSYSRFLEYPTATTKSGIEIYIKKLISKYIKSAIASAFKSQKEVGAVKTVFGKTLDWTKLTYNQRSKEIKSLSEDSLNSIFKKAICKFHAIPDNMSISDARNEMGRPYLYEHELLSTTTLRSGVIHFVSVYGTCTETQIKNLIGFPDITIIKGSFGFYCWVQSTQIQFFFITKCINPSLFGTRKSQIDNWLNSTKEKDNIQKRADARFSILTAIVKAQTKTK
ncbi:MAG: hypothetical protein KAH48_04580 [Chlorobi bacterium]|nr:hypothetical protein [Chlorobiota bacterium]